MFRLRFDKISFAIFALLFLVEVFIALFVRDRIIRPYGGDLVAYTLGIVFCYAIEKKAALRNKDLAKK